MRCPQFLKTCKLAVAHGLRRWSQSRVKIPSPRNIWRTLRRSNETGYGGGKRMVTLARDPVIDHWFPGAFADGYDRTSDATYRYNCIAWAADVNTIAWWPHKKTGFFWPPGIPHDDSLNTF